MTSYLSVIRELHVLFVDHEWNSSTTTDLIEACHYRVIPVLLATAAISMISNGNTKIDFIIANITSPDVFKLLQLAVSMEIPTILMSNDDDITSMGAWAIENGAFLYIKRPTSPDMLRYLWQHMARETMRVTRECERLIAASCITPPCGVGFGDVENPNNSFAMDNGKSKMNYYYNEKYVENEYNFGNMMSQGKVKRKMCTEWTEELHKKFVDAALQLGKGNIYPREILEKMNVPGLTRAQVASHLQKCRNAEYRLRKDRKSTLRFNPKSSDGEGSNYKPRRFGSMPRFNKEKSKDRVYDHGSRSEMEAKVSETGMTNQSSDGEGSSHKPRRFGSMPEIMKADSNERVDDHGSRSEMEAMASETGTYHQYLDYEALLSFPPLESIAHSPHHMGLSPPQIDYKLFTTT